MSRLFLTLFLFCASVAFSLSQPETCRLLARLAETIPQTESSIDPARFEAWVNAHHNRYRDVAAFVRDNLKLVSREEFSKALDAAVEDLLSKKFDPERITFVYHPGGKDEPWKKSGAWITGQILERYPELRKADVIDARKFLETPLPNGREVVVVDDATYSGDQLTDTLHHIINTPSPGNLRSITCLIPYVASTAAVRGNRTSFPRGPIGWLKHETMPTIGELLDAQGKSHLRPVVRTMWNRNALDLPLTIFFHKVPDNISFPQWIASGAIKNEKPSEQGPPIPFIHEGTTPYREVAEITEGSP